MLTIFITNGYNCGIMLEHYTTISIGVLDNIVTIKSILKRYDIISDDIYFNEVLIGFYTSDNIHTAILNEIKILIGI